MTDEIAGKIVEAYRSNPLLTGLLILIIGLVIGFGWWESRRVAAVDAFVQAQLAKQDELQRKLLDLAQRCNANNS